jgi:hypothetical protein
MSRRPDAAAASQVPALTYTLPTASGTLWLGLGPVAVGALAVTVLVAVLLMLTGAPLWLAVVVTAIGSATGLWPVAGRSPLQWLPVAVRHATGRLTGHAGWTTAADTGDVADLSLESSSEEAALETGRARGQGRPPHTSRLALPRGWGRLHIGQAAPDVALIGNRSCGTSTVVLAVTGTGTFGLLDPHAQDSELSRWGGSLATLLALPRLRDLQWLTHTRPQSLPSSAAADLTGADLNGPYLNGPGLNGSDLTADYADLVRHTCSQALTHTHLLALTLTDQDLELVRSTVRQASATLLAADLLCCPICPEELPRLLRRLLDPALPDDATGRSNATAHAAARSPEPPALSLRTGWSSCRTDDTHHRAYAVTGWPRLPLPADWLAPLLHHPPEPGTARTLTVHARPVSPQHASRRARASAAKARLDSADRQRLGFTADAGSALDAADAEHTEGELLAGYRMADLTALTVLHAPDLTSLEASARDLTALTVSQRIDLRPLHGQHHHAVAAALPLGKQPGGRS